MKTRMQRNKTGRLIAFALAVCLLFSACSRRSTEESVSAGQLDKIGCFLFIFDSRTPQQQLVRDMDKGDVPTRMRCQLYDVVREIDGSETETPIEGKSIDTEDEAFIRKTYYAITDLIVVGQMGYVNNTNRARMIFDLAGGEICELVFQSNSIIEIGGQNYMLESSGRLWKLLEKIY